MPPAFTQIYPYKLMPLPRTCPLPIWISCPGGSAQFALLAERLPTPCPVGLPCLWNLLPAVGADHERVRKEEKVEANGRGGVPRGGYHPEEEGLSSRRTYSTERELMCLESVCSGDESSQVPIWCTEKVFRATVVFSCCHGCRVVSGMFCVGTA